MFRTGRSRARLFHWTTAVHPEENRHFPREGQEKQRVQEQSGARGTAQHRTSYRRSRNRTTRKLRQERTAKPKNWDLLLSERIRRGGAKEQPKFRAPSGRTGVQVRAASVSLALRRQYDRADGGSATAGPKQSDATAEEPAGRHTLKLFCEQQGRASQAKGQALETSERQGKTEKEEKETGESSRRQQMVCNVAVPGRRYPDAKTRHSGVQRCGAREIANAAGVRTLRFLMWWSLVR